ncbi:MAG: FAD-dependent oxidoreductase [Rubrobacteraceae bacterium]
MPYSKDKQRVVLAGGGHAHLHSLLNTAQFVELGCDVVLVNPSPYLYYSGMATGVISGTYTPEQDRIDVRRLAERGGGRFVEGRVVGVLGETREVLLENGERMPYDYASLCIGSEVAGSFEDESRIVPVKPVENTAEIRRRILRHECPGGPNVLVVGGGAAGCEIAANAVNLMRQKNLGGLVTIAEAGPALLGDSPEKARREITSYFQERGVQVLTKAPVVSYADGVAEIGAGRKFEVDLLVSSVGIVPRALKQGSYLLTGEDGGMWVNHYLQSVSDPRIFGGGDSISFRGEALPRLGVYGIRQGPVLFRNLLAAVEGRSLETYEPQKRYLYILNFGDGAGLAVYGALSWRGRLAMMLKHAIDRRFMKRYDV